MRKALLGLLVLLVGVGVVGVLFAYVAKAPETPMPQTTPIISSPTFATSTYVHSSADTIVVTAPAPGTTVGKIITVTGKARGPWFFEASFPIEIRNASNVVIATGVAQTQSNWMTTAFVPFTASVPITNGYQGPATLVLKKDNPSGEPQNDASMIVPIIIS